jgi:predicted DNA-binding transcriptional regulator AlpA
MSHNSAAELHRNGDRLVTLRPVMPVGVHELADLLGLTRQQVHRLIKTADFPAPLFRLAHGATWDGHDVLAWNNQRPRRRI